MHWWPLRLKVGGEYDLKEQDFKATAECHDAVLGGEFSFDVMHSSVEYAKRFDLGGVSQLALKGRCNLGDGRERWDASFGFVIEPKASAGPLGVSTHVSNTTKGYDVVTEIPVSKLVSAELCGHLSLPLPVAVGFTRVSSTLKTSCADFSFFFFRRSKCACASSDGCISWPLRRGVHGAHARRGAAGGGAAWERHRARRADQRHRQPLIDVF